MAKLHLQPTTVARTGILEALAFPRDPKFAKRRFDRWCTCQGSHAIYSTSRCFFRRTKQAIILDDIIVPNNRVEQVALTASNHHGVDDLEIFRPPRHLEN